MILIVCKKLFRTVRFVSDRHIRMILTVCKKVVVPDGSICIRMAHPYDLDCLQKIVLNSFCIRLAHSDDLPGCKKVVGPDCSICNRMAHPYDLDS